MERLTKNPHQLVLPMITKKETIDKISKMYKKLFEYENTEMPPEQIIEMIPMFIDTYKEKKQLDIEVAALQAEVERLNIESADKERAYLEEFNLCKETVREVIALKDRCAVLEQQLKNAIVPKFKAGQEVWYFMSLRWIATNGETKHKQVIESFRIDYLRFFEDKLEYVQDTGSRFSTPEYYFENQLYATESEAQAALDKAKEE